MNDFYIGSLKLHISTDYEFVLWNWDELFSKSTLPCTKETDITIQPVSQLPPVIGQEYRAPGMIVYKNDAEEYRLYDIPQGKRPEECDPSIMSYRKDKSSIKIFVKEGIIKNHKVPLRPWFYSHLEELLIENKALILHSASIAYMGDALLFTAPSGTGKTTQTDLWHKYMQNVDDINGDRTLLQYTEKGWYGCGFPVFGSTVRCSQCAAPLKAIIILRQGPVDQIKRLTPSQAATLLYSEITVPDFHKEYVYQSMDLIERLIGQVPVLLYSCTMEKSAVDTLYQYLYGEK